MHFIKSKIFLLIFLLVAFLCSCEVINPEETIPSYLRIDSIKLDGSTYGASLSKISDAWVYIDDEIVGAYELPAKFPILIDGKHKVFIKAGIKVNGIAETRGSYPFFDGYTTEVNFVKDSVITLKPIIKYYENTQFFINEDFETSGVLFEKTSRSDTSLEKTNDPRYVLNGNYSGVVHLTSSKNLFECKTIEEFKLPSASKPIYLELNYKTDVIFTVGFFANTFQSTKQHSVFNVNTNTSWNKIYINLTEAVSNYPDAIDFNIFIGATLPESQTEATIYFDNIRLIYF